VQVCRWIDLGEGVQRTCRVSSTRDVTLLATRGQDAPPVPPCRCAPTDAGARRRTPVSSGRQRAATSRVRAAWPPS